MGGVFSWRLLVEFLVKAWFILSNKLAIYLFILFIPTPIGDETKVKAYACNIVKILNFSVIYFNSLAEIELPYYATEITSPSSPFALSLARHLHSVGAKMYGAFWCSHCQEQKEVCGHS